MEEIRLPFGCGARKESARLDEGKGASGTPHLCQKGAVVLGLPDSGARGGIRLCVNVLHFAAPTRERWFNAYSVIREVWRVEHTKSLPADCRILVCGLPLASTEYSISTSKPLATLAYTSAQRAPAKQKRSIDMLSRVFSSVVGTRCFSTAKPLSKVGSSSRVARRKRFFDQQQGEKRLVSCHSCHALYVCELMADLMPRRQGQASRATNSGQPQQEAGIDRQVRVADRTTAT